MKEVFKILKQKKLQFFFLFYILLLLPFLSPIAENKTLLDKTAIFVVCGLLFVAISILSTFISSKSEKIIYSILLILSIIPGSIYLGYLLFARVLLEQNSVTSLFETNPEESKEFVAYYMNIWVIVGVLIYAAIPIIMLCKMKSFKPLKIKNHRLIFIASIVIIMGITGINQLSRSVYFINIYKTFLNYKIRVHHEIASIKARQIQPFVVDAIYADTVPQTLVVVIGESENKHHMSLYGYKRNTNPLLSQRSDSLMSVYTDVVSPQVHTIPVMRSILSMVEPEYPDYFTEKPSLFELFNRAGYKTYLLSNQEFSDKYSSSYDILLSLASVKTNLATLKQHDDIVLPALNNILKDTTVRNKLVVIHLIGNHMAYKRRYPKEYIVFNHRKDKLVEDKPFRDIKAKETIDQYDNSVLYNDFVVNSIISQLEKQNAGKAAMIYFSDHGEELYDYRQFAGHAYEKLSPSMCEVPFLIWVSPLYKSSRPDLVFSTDRPYSSGDFIYSISDIAGLAYEGYDDSRSIFSSHFIPRERFVGLKRYEDIKLQFAH